MQPNFTNRASIDSLLFELTKRYMSEEMHNRCPPVVASAYSRLVTLIARFYQEIVFGNINSVVSFHISLWYIHYELATSYRPRISCT